MPELILPGILRKLSSKEQESNIQSFASFEEFAMVLKESKLKDPIRLGLTSQEDEQRNNELKIAAQTGKSEISAFSVWYPRDAAVDIANLLTITKVGLLGWHTGEDIIHLAVQAYTVTRLMESSGRDFKAKLTRVNGGIPTGNLKVNGSKCKDIFSPNHSRLFGARRTTRGQI